MWSGWIHQRFRGLRCHSFHPYWRWRQQVLLKCWPTSTRLHGVTFQKIVGQSSGTAVSNSNLTFISFFSCHVRNNKRNKEIIILWHVMPWRWVERHWHFGTPHYFLQNVSSFTYHNTRTCHKTVILTPLAVGTINIITKNKKNYIYFQNPMFLIYMRVGMSRGHSILIYVFTHHSSPRDVTT